MTTTLTCTCGAERHGVNCPVWLAEFYPDGRVFYDETDDRPAFIAACHGLGLCPAVNYPPPETELEPFATVEVPAEKLGAFYALDLRVGT